MLLKALARVRAQLVTRPWTTRYANNRDIEMTMANHRLERRKDLLIRQVAGRSKKDQRVRVNSIEHNLLLLLISRQQYWPGFPKRKKPASHSPLLAYNIV